MTPPPKSATLSLNQTTTVAGDGGYSNVGTIEGWLQIENKTITDPQRLLTLTGRKLTGEKDEFWIEFSPASKTFVFSTGSSADAARFADGQFHHFALTVDRNDGLSISFDGDDPKKVTSDDEENDKLKADSLFQKLTIGDASGSQHSGFIGKIAGLHLWKKKLTSDEIRAAGGWHAAYCPIPEYGFKEIPPIELLGFFNPQIPSFIFYYEPEGYWVMDGTETEDPQQADLLDCDQNHHAVYDSPRYFLTTREKATNKLYIISDNGDKTPLCLAPDQSQQFVFTTDDLMLTFRFELKKLSPAGKSTQEAVRESFSIESKPGKALPDEFRPVAPYDSVCIRPTVLQEDTGLDQQFGSIFAKTPYNLTASKMGWNEKSMKDPFDSSSDTGAHNEIFALPPNSSKCYVKTNDLAVPFGFKFRLTTFAEGSMHSTLIANGSDLRTAATTSKSIKGNVKGGCAFVSGSVSFNYNSELGNTEENMYDKEVMHSQHTFFVTTHTMVLDKPNVRFNGKGELKGFWPDILDYAKNKKRGEEIFSSYGTHYAHAICFGARGRARQDYTKDTMSTLLESCKKIGWGIEAKISGKIGGFKGGIGGGYSQQDANDDSNKISATQNSEESEYSCIGSSSCDKSGEAHAVDQTAVPVLLDLRPITELLAPPFFDTYEMTVTARQKLIGDLKIYLAGKEPSKVDVFHFLSLSFLRPWGYYQDSPTDPRPGRLRKMPGGLFDCDPSISVKVTGSSSSGKETLLQFQNFSFPQESSPPIKQAFCYSGNKTDNQVFVEVTLPEHYYLCSYDSRGPLGEYSQDVVEPIMKLEFALDDERLLSAEGVTGTFVLAIDESGSGSLTFAEEPPYGLPGTIGGPEEVGFQTFVLIFPVALKKLNLQDAFFNGLPADWKEAEWKTLNTVELNLIQ
jgi:hypothetical protein